MRAGRSLFQSVASVALVAVGPALVSAAQGGTVDMGALGIAGGQAAVAAALAYLHNRVRPAGGAQLGEITFRANRTIAQNLVAAAIVPGAAAIATTGGDDVKMLGVAGLQAAVAGVIALVHNWVSPRATGGDSDDDQPGGQGGGDSVGTGRAGAGEPFRGGRYGADSPGDGYDTV